MFILKDLLSAIIRGLVIRGLFAIPVMWLWNTSLFPAVESLNQINYLESLGLVVLLSIASGIWNYKNV